MKGKIYFIIAIVVSVCTCSTLPKDIPADLTVMELVQRAQEASDRNNYNRAYVYYTCVLERYPFDNEAVCGAKYEIAFIHYKQKKYDESKREFTELLERYNNEDAELLPSKYRILSEAILSAIVEKQKSPFKSWFKKDKAKVTAEV